MWRTSDLDGSCDEDHVLAAAVRRAVEPAEAGLDDESGLLEELLPFLAGDPGERHGGRSFRAADREGQRSLVRVPVGELVDPRLALEPAAVRLGDVVGLRLEDV